MQSPAAERIKAYNKPTMWNTLSDVVKQSNALSLGSGFPSWQPPEFFKEHLAYATEHGSHQYVRSYGSLDYVQAIAEFHKPTFGQLDPQNNVLVVNGGGQGLYCSIMGLINPGDQVIVFDPSFDFYRPYVHMAGGIVRGVSLTPRKQQSKQELLKKIQKEVKSDEADEWEIDFNGFEQTLNEKTKIVIMNSPHNPVGKVFTQEELSKLASILQKYPQIVVLEDNVYIGITFDDMHGKPLPKLALQPGLKQRSLSVYSAGKMFAATGIRSGWVVGSAELIKAARVVHQYSFFCQYNIIEKTCTLSLQDLCKPNNTYLNDSASRLWQKRDILFRELLACPYDIKLWIPKGGYFIIVDISSVNVMEKYLIDQKGNKRTKDVAFMYQLAHQKRVLCVPLSSFYGPENASQGQRYVRFAFCKDDDVLMEASKRMQQ